jgi:hypothetical protein
MNLEVSVPHSGTKNPEGKLVDFKDSLFFEWDPALMGNRIPAFRGEVMPLYSKVERSYKKREENSRTY